MKASHFILVHGGCHGAWCWYKVATLLEAAGHRVTTPEMRASGIDPQQAEDLETVSKYSQPMMDLMASLPSDEKVILVGHSFGGVVLSLAMEKFPHKISVAVFLTAFMSSADLTLVSLLHEYYRRLGSQMDNKFFFHNGLEKPPTSFSFGEEFLATRVYQLCPPEVLKLASTLLRPLFLLSDDNVQEDVVLSKEKHDSVRRVYIVSEEDKIIEEDFQRFMIKNNPPNEVKEVKGSDHMADTVVSKEKYGSVRRVYVLNEEDKLFKKDFQLYMIKNNPTNEVVKELKGSDHMAMFSNPKELFSILQDIAKSYT